jgi:hypothetical protein
MVSHRTAALLPLLGFMVACSSSSSSSSNDAGTSGDTRSTVTCANLETQLAPAGGTFMAGTWGDVPSTLQKLPSDGTLCGTIVLADGGEATAQEVVITTSLTGADLSTFYTPIFTSMSCTAQTALIAGGLDFTCPNSDVATVQPSGNEQYILFSFGSL